MDEHREHEETRLLTVDRAARRLCVSVRTLRKLIAAGTIPVVRVSANRICVDAVDLEHYIDAHRECGSPREKTGAGGTDETLDLG